MSIPKVMFLGLQKMIDLASLDFNTLPSLPLSNKKALPEVTCIYLAIDSLGSVQYVGQSINLRQRWANHHRFSQLAELDVCITWIEVSKPELLNEIESALIEWFDPPLNEALKTGYVRKRKNQRDLSTPCRIIWRLKNIMAEYDISGVDLAKKLGVSENSISKLRRSKTMPRMNGQELDRLFDALNELAGPNANIGVENLIKRQPNK